MALQLTVAKAVVHGLVGDDLPFFRTTKGVRQRRSGRFPALWEGVLGVLLLLASTVLHLTNEQQVQEVTIFSAVMLVQSLPFLAAVAIASFEQTPLNEFATWRKLASMFTFEPRGPQPTAGPPASGGVSIVP
jgi:hypothetical protein